MKRIVTLEEKSTWIIGVVIFFCIGLGSGYYLWHDSAGEIVFHQKRADDPSLKFTNPLLSCGISENKEFEEYKPLEQSITSLIKRVDTKNENTVSVYYKDFTNGRWFGINEEKEYSPASLMKVPIMIAYLKIAENQPEILTKQLYYDGTTEFSNEIEYYKSPKQLTAGHYYTVDELLRYMIENSDNKATVLLFNHINNNSLVEIMTDIGLKLPSTQGAASGIDDFMTVKSYSYLFRLLYNSTYLSREMSEKALTLLSYADFTQGIVGGLPTGTESAQKFGERTIIDPITKDTVKELHDCGIVYYPKHPYLLCIMTKGKNFETLSSTIKGISKIIYDSNMKTYH